MIRAFIALEPSQVLRSLLFQVGQALEERLPPGRMRWVKPEAMHLTLCFLGDIPPSQVDPVQEAIANATAGLSPITFGASGLGCFPNTRRPRVIWVGITEPTGTLARLKSSLDQHLAPLGFQKDRGRFSPHLTLGRVHKRADRSEVQEIGRLVASATLQEVATATVDHVHLIRSDLRPQGPLYTILASAPLLTSP